jgi:hypothetical protein
MRASHEVTPTIVDFEEEIERSFLQQEWSVFWAEQFWQLATVELAQETLMQLVSVGKLRCVAELRCCEGHSVWTSEFARLDEGRACTCEECEEAGVPAEFTYLRFEISESWLVSLKKKAQLQPQWRR